MSTQDIVFYKKEKWNCNGKMLDISAPIVMGILNVTPDSFYDGGKYTEEFNIVEQAKKIIEEGAGIIDMGAYSTRPGAKDISKEEELRRLIPAIKTVRKNFHDAIISADTFRARVAMEAVNSGADIINDVSGGTIDDEMFSAVAKLKVPYILTHIQGTPQNMQKNPHYNNVIEDVKNYFQQKIKKLNELGVAEIIIDPGFGFGKTLEHNYELLNNLVAFKTFQLPVLCGISRKGMVYKLLKTKPENALNGTTVLNTMALLQGANILRVHDVKEAKEVLKIVNYYQSFHQNSNIVKC